MFEFKLFVINYLKKNEHLCIKIKKSQVGNLFLDGEEYLKYLKKIKN